MPTAHSMLRQSATHDHTSAPPAGSPASALLTGSCAAQPCLLSPAPAPEAQSRQQQPAQQHTTPHPTAGRAAAAAVPPGPMQLAPGHQGAWLAADCQGGPAGLAGTTCLAHTWPRGKEAVQGEAGQQCNTVSCFTHLTKQLTACLMHTCSNAVSMHMKWTRCATRPLQLACPHPGIEGHSLDAK
jgi:hypothetical protein